MAESVDYLSRAIAAAGVLTTNWFPPSAPDNWIPDEFWRTPVICTQLVDLMALTDKVDFTETIENARIKSEDILAWCAYYDDLTWWGRLFLHGYDYFQSKSNSALATHYFNDAVIVCEQLIDAWNAWDSPQDCGGGIWWMRPPPPPPISNKFKASNSTLGFMEISLGLYFITKDQKYLDWGQKAWNWIAEKNFVDKQGLVWGALSLDCTLDPANVPVLSLQGEALAPLWSLYQATKNTEYLDIAEKVAQGTIAIMVWRGTQIMQDRDDGKWAGESDDWKRNNSGDTPFKGLFAAYLGAFTKDLATVSDPARQKSAATYAAFLRANADAVWTNYPGQMFSMDWHTLDQDYQPIPDADIVNASLQYSGLAALTAAAQVGG